MSVKNLPSFIPSIGTAVSGNYTGTFYALYVGTTGNITVTMQGGGNVTFANVPAGIFLMAGAGIVGNTTTAGNITALS